MDEATFWGIVEIMGHKRLAGRVSEQFVAGTAFVRVDVPATEEEPAFTKLVGGGSIYGITPTTEDVAKLAAQRLKARPVEIYLGPLAERVAVPALGYAGGPPDDDYKPEDRDDDGVPY